MRNFICFFTAMLINMHLISAQVGQADPQNLFPANDSLVVISAELFAHLVKAQNHDEMMEASTIINLEKTLNDIENAKLAQAGLSVYPDVIQDYLQMELSYDRDYTVSVYNSDHDVVLSLENAFGSNQLNLHDLESGTYKLELVSGDQSFSKRIRKE